MNAIADAFSKDGVFTEFVEQIPGVGLIPAAVHAAAGNEDHAVAALGQQANVILTTAGGVAGAAAGLAVGGPMGAIAGGAAGGALGGALGTMAEAGIATTIDDPEARAGLAEWNVRDIAIGAGIGAFSGAIGGYGGNLVRGSQAAGGTVGNWVTAGANKGALNGMLRGAAGGMALTAPWQAGAAGMKFTWKNDEYTGYGYGDAPPPSTGQPGDDRPMVPFDDRHIDMFGRSGSQELPVDGEYYMGGDGYYYPRPSIEEQNEYNSGASQNLQARTGELVAEYPSYASNEYPDPSQAGLSVAAGYGGDDVGYYGPGLATAFDDYYVDDYCDYPAECGTTGWMEPVYEGDGWFEPTEWEDPMLPQEMWWGEPESPAQWATNMVWECGTITEVGPPEYICGNEFLDDNGFFIDQDDLDAGVPDHDDDWGFDGDDGLDDPIAVDGPDDDGPVSEADRAVAALLGVDLPDDPEAAIDALLLKLVESNQEEIAALKEQVSELEDELTLAYEDDLAVDAGGADGTFVDPVTGEEVAVLIEDDVDDGDDLDDGDDFVEGGGPTEEELAAVPHGGEGEDDPLGMDVVGDLPEGDADAMAFDDLGTAPDSDGLGLDDDDLGLGDDGDDLGLGDSGDDLGLDSAVAGDTYEAPAPMEAPPVAEEPAFEEPAAFDAPPTEDEQNL